MEIHKYEKIWLAGALLLIVGFIATVSYGAVGAGIEMIDNEGGQVDPKALDQHPKFSEPGTYKTGPNQYDVYVVAQQFAYLPGTSDPIRVPANSEVTFHVTSRDVIHGYEIVGTNANTMAIPGQVSQMTVKFGEAKEYGLLCNEYCGAAHHAMEGKIVVVPEDEWNESMVVN
ncbi:cytochrome C oxidase subunit II [Halogeometricum borinquense]|uniref:Cytochrome C oxidase subunit II n=1 Tax=Halogeometricum borinquense TaxID=60847 RepID=A0A482T1K4_9EURY|nr:cytochrome c oxidase subunit II [Halogeometricum borinquense]RYJ08600.1 cytochrome C oxidase subunit II [Halogeometricum borinquense]